MKNLLLLHGALGSSKQFQQLEEILSEIYKIHKFDFAGHGLNNESAKPLRIELFADEIVQYIQSNNLNGIDVFGYSMGGYAALYSAYKNPEMFGSIFTLATKFDWNPDSSARESKMLNPDIILEKVPKYAAELESLHGNNWKALLEQTAEMMINLGNNPSLNADILKNINNKIMISVGDKDNMVSLEESILAYRNLPNSSFLVLPKTIHPIGKLNIKQLSFQLKEFLGID
jgi:pimeloyl-ACP methyl ester carboxylesterase